MRWPDLLLYVLSAIPLAWAWRANRTSTLLHALSWAAAAWTAWGAVLVLAEVPAEPAVRYLALCLTACAGIAVLGARRPIAGPWNFVVLGLLGVLLLPLGEHLVLGTPLLDPLRLAFIGGTLAVGVLNYLPTRFALPVLLVAAGSGWELALLLNGDEGSAWPRVGPLAVILACWAGELVAHWKRPAEPLDRLWLTFRDNFGLMWGQRVREQFNQAARNAGWPLVLRWSGLRRAGSADTSYALAEVTKTLKALLRRFAAQ
jgi:hypothetical protein